MKRLLLIALVALAAMMPLRAADDELAALRKDYKMLTNRYGDRLESRTAHYIFAIDVSNSMQNYRDTTRSSIINFINAVPDGDQISIILMGDKAQTVFLDNIQCITLDGSVRQAIKEALRSPRFNFDKDGSDGYTMAYRVLEALNSVGSSELTFLYTLTDFEYWTRDYHYNKNAENWASLRDKLSDKHRGMLCGYGIEINFDNVRHPEAIFKPELDMIFGRLDYRPTSSPKLLSQWFGHVIDNIRANKIYAMLKADWAALTDSCRVQLKASGADVVLKVDIPESDLIDGYHAHAVPVEGFNALPLAESNGDKKAVLGTWQQCRHWWPCFTRVGGDTMTVEVTYDSRYAKEIASLQELCNGKDGERLESTKNYTLETPTMWVWNSTLAWPLWLLIILVVLAAIASVVYTLTRKYDKRLSFTVYRTGGQLPCNGDTRRYPYTLGDGCTLDVPSATWKVRVTTHKGVWLAFGWKNGYYLTLLAGNRATLYNNRNDKVQATLRRGQKALLFGRNNKKPLRLEIDEDGMGNITTIEIN